MPEAPGKKRRYRRVTAGELLSQLEQDKEYVEMMRRKEEEWAADEARLKADEEGLVLELRNAGFYVESVWDLVNTNASYPEAVPILIRHLQEPHLLRTLDGILRSLTVPEMKGKALSDLRTMLFQLVQLEWLTARLIVRSATRQDMPSVVEMLRDVDFGRHRAELLPALRHMPREERADLLDELEKDPELAGKVRAYRKRISRKT